MAAALALACGLLRGQPFDRARQPAPAPARPWKLPPVFETTLPNGLGVVLVDDARAPLLTLRLVFACGTAREPEDMPGLAAVVAEMLTQGTAVRSARQISQTVETIGGTLGASAGADYLAIGGSAVPEHWPDLLELLADVAGNAFFPDVELQLALQNRRRSVAQQRALPGAAAEAELRRALFGEHPGEPTAASLDRINRNAVRAYRDRWFAPNNAWLIAVGRMPPRADLLAAITARFGGQEKKPLPETPALPAPAPAAARRLILIDRPGAERVEVRAGARLAAAGATPAEMLLSARLGPRASLSEEAGLLSLAVETSPELAAQSVRSLLEDIDLMISAPADEEELSDAKIRAEGLFYRRIEAQAGLADELMTERVRKHGPEYAEHWTGAIESVRAEEIQAAAKKYLSGGGMVVVVAGDAAKIGASLEKIGKFEVVKTTR